MKPKLSRFFLAMALLTFSGFAAEVSPVIPRQASDFSVADVKLLDSPFLQAMQTDKAFIMSLDPDRLLSGFRTEAGLAPKAVPYGGWEEIKPGVRYTMAGHTLGHYMSALVLMAQADHDPECRRRVDYVVDQLAECQKANGNGLLAAFPQCKEWCAEISAGNIYRHELNNLDGAYVPLYSMHKVMCGLRDAWLAFGNQTARDTLVRQVDWLAALIAPLTDEQLQKVLDTEHGGVMESATDVYVITGNPKYLALARRLVHHAFFDPLARGEDRLSGVHGNASIPKAFGAERFFELTGEKNFDEAARNFWNNVVYQRSFVTGDHGASEFFFATNAFETTGIAGTGPETCNSYNMIKLTREYWLESPSARTADFIERNLFNEILPSIDRERGGYVYFTPVGPGARHSFDTTGFVCCNGTGMENHAKYGEFIYAHGPGRLWVDLMIPSELSWSNEQAVVKMETDFPKSGQATLNFTLKEPREFTVSVRRPGWILSGEMKLRVNGAVQSVSVGPDSYASLKRTWKTGDKLAIEWPMSVHTEFLPHSTNWLAALWGPIVLAGETGAVARAPGRRGRGPIPLANSGPLLLGDATDVAGKIKPTDSSNMTFQMDNLAKPTNPKLVPFYMVGRDPYQIYWRVVDPDAYSTMPGAQPKNR